MYKIEELIDINNLPASFSIDIINKLIAEGGRIDDIIQEINDNLEEEKEQDENDKKENI
tara:strand:- start:6424 stop:6600 length:177 start_codon:yes stop_codon:yes gene_type:complete